MEYESASDVVNVSHCASASWLSFLLPFPKNVETVSPLLFEFNPAPFQTVEFRLCALNSFSLQGPFLGELMDWCCLRVSDSGRSQWSVELLLCLQVEDLVTTNQYTNVPEHGMGG